MFDAKREFSRHELYWFGPLFAVFNLLVAVVVFRILDWTLSWNWTTQIWCALVGVLVLGYYAVPSWRITIYRAWLWPTLQVGRMVSFALLVLVFYIVVTPIGVLLRILGHDALQIRRKPAATYWQSRSGNRPARDYFRQF